MIFQIEFEVDSMRKSEDEVDKSEVADKVMEVARELREGKPHGIISGKAGNKIGSFFFSSVCLG